MLYRYKILVTEKGWFFRTVKSSGKQMPRKRSKIDLLGRFLYQMKESQNRRRQGEVVCSAGLTLVIGEGDRNIG